MANKTPANINYKSLYALIRKSTGYGFARVSLAVVVYILLTPFILHKLGKDLYGLWSLNSAVMTFLLMSDFGFKNCLIHFTAANLNDSLKLNKIFNAIFCCFLIVSIICICLMLLLNDFIIVNVFNIPYIYWEEASYVLIITTIGFSIRLLASSFQAVIEGNQRVYYTQKVYIIWLIFNLVATICGLTYFPSIYTVGIVSLLGNLLIFIMFVIDVKRKYRYILLNFTYVNYETIKNLLPYSIGIQLAAIFILMREPLLKVFVSRFYGLETLAAFDIAYRITIQCMSFAIIPVLTALPVASLLRKNTKVLRNVIKRYLLWIVITLTLPAFIILFYSRELINLWLGSGYDDAALILPTTFIAFSIYYIAEPLYKTIQGLGWSIISAFVQGLFLAVLFLALWILLEPLGFQSIPYSLIIASSMFVFCNLICYKLFLKSD